VESQTREVEVWTRKQFQAGLHSGEETAAVAWCLGLEGTQLLQP